MLDVSFRSLSDGPTSIWPWNGRATLLPSGIFGFGPRLDLYFFMSLWIVWLLKAIIFWGNSFQATLNLHQRCYLPSCLWIGLQAIIWVWTWRFCCIIRWRTRCWQLCRTLGSLSLLVAVLFSKRYRSLFPLIVILFKGISWRAAVFSLPSDHNFFRSCVSNKPKKFCP